MSRDLDLGVEIVGIPIERESDGLAMSSRNVRLTPDDRSAAVVLSQALAVADRAVADGERDTAVVIALATELIAGEPRASLEYVELVDDATLEPIDEVRGRAVVLVATPPPSMRTVATRAPSGARTSMSVEANDVRRSPPADTSVATPSSTRRSRMAFR